MAVPDPYGVDLAIGEDGDLVVWPNGELGTVAGAETCIQALRLRIFTYHGELPLWPDFGSELHDKVGQRLDPDLLSAQANIEMRRIVESDRRFLSVTDLQAVTVDSALDGAPTSAAIRGKLMLAGGDALSVSDLQEARVDEVLDPAADLDEDFTEPSLEDDGNFTFTNDQFELDDLQDAADLRVAGVDGGVFDETSQEF